ncbi:unnamed protein product [Knipowitschia caucasica]|uniref:Uncharacterized protein n=1 Tax=Knipowitschia caucasica TaxID=637954 RepID=A0AAV2M5S1_KNICA
MFRLISNLLFGAEDKAVEDIRPMEVEDEEWHVVSHQEAVAEEHHKAAVIDHETNTAVLGSTCSQLLENSAISSETQDQKKKSAAEALPAVLSLSKAVGPGTPCVCVHKAKDWVPRHGLSRRAMQRQNRIRQGVHPQSFHLQQPGQRSLYH